MNAQVQELLQESDTSFKVSLLPTSPGFLSVTLAKTITSSSGSTLMNPPIMEFNYVGASIITARVTSLSSTTASVSVTTTKPVLLWGLYSTSATSIRPSALVIMSQGQLYSETAATSHLFILPDLTPETKYTVYFAGKESSGVLMNNDEDECTLTLTTRGETTEIDYDQKSDGTICESGWSVSSSSSELQLLPCSYHGYCQQKKCICTEPYTSSNCGTIREEELTHTNETHQLIHVKIQMWGTFKAQTKLEDFWKLSLRESIAE